MSGRGQQYSLGGAPQQDAGWGQVPPAIRAKISSLGLVPASYGASAATDPMVYMGQKDVTKYRQGKPLPGGYQPVPYTTQTSNTMGLDAAQGQIYNWVGTPRLDKWAQYLIGHGVIDPKNYTFDDLKGWWDKAVEEAANLYAVGKKVTPWQAVEMISAVGTSPNGSGPVGYTGPRVTHQTSTSVQNFTDLDARAMGEDAFAQALGKASVSGKQKDALQAALNAYAEAHPQITRTTSHINSQGRVTSTNSSTSGGISAQGAGEIVENFAQDQPGYGEYQASTTLFNALLAAIQSPVDV